MADIELRHFEDVLNKQLANATIGGISSADIAWPEKTYAPKKGIPYLKPETAARDRQPLGIGANAVQEWRATYQVSIYTPRDTGTRLPNGIASEILRAFPRGLSLQTPQGVWVIVTRSTVPAPVPFGDWVNQPVMIDWFAHEPP